ncbi:MAG: hypothetical protein A2Y23_00480 [Clostridiales bacterium GWB2_37_7]|nr:MAG: hypothetical protein A2Y23_00480 [Clostridiales bacterium GWB2_37_7]
MNKFLGKKKSILMLVMIALLITIPFSIYAASSSWSSTAASYGPSTGSVQTVATNYTYPTSDKLKVYSTFKYTSSAITAIKNYYNNNSYYPGIDITDIGSNSHIDATGWYYTNLPNGKFDTDDDDWNTWYEETEITSLSPNSMVAGTTYYFDVEFREMYGEYDVPDKSFSGTFEVNTSESEAAGSEYNTVHFSRLTNVGYTTTQ